MCNTLLSEEPEEPGGDPGEELEKKSEKKIEEKQSGYKKNLKSITLKINELLVLYKNDIKKIRAKTKYGEDIIKQLNNDFKPSDFNINNLKVIENTCKIYYGSEEKMREINIAEDTDLVNYVKLLSYIITLNILKCDITNILSELKVKNFCDSYENYSIHINNIEQDNAF